MCSRLNAVIWTSPESWITRNPWEPLNAQHSPGCTPGCNIRKWSSFLELNDYITLLERWYEPHHLTYNLALHFKITVLWDMTPCSLVNGWDRNLLHWTSGQESSTWKDGGFRFLWNVCTYLEGTPCSIPENNNLTDYEGDHLLGCNAQ